MALKYVVTKRVFGFDKTNTEKYVAKSVGSGKMNFDKMCEKETIITHSYLSWKKPKYIFQTYVPLPPLIF